MTAGTMNLRALGAEKLMASTSPAGRDDMLKTLARQGDVANLQLLLNYDAAIAKRSGEEALFAACTQGHLEIVKALHAAGVRINGFYFDDRDPSVTIHQYPLYQAFYEGKWDVATWLIEQGAKPMQQPRLLGNMVPKAPHLFAHMLDHFDHMRAYLTPIDQRNGRDDKILADALWAAVEVIVYNNYTAFAEILLERGMPPEMLYRMAMKKQAADILDHLYSKGFRPQVEVEQQALIDLYERDANQDRLWKCAAVRHKWLRHDSHIMLSGGDADMCRKAIAQDYAASIHDKPAVLTLARGGYFASDVMPVVVRYGACVLAVKDRYGTTLADVIAARGEEKALFVPEVWAGQAAAARSVYDALPDAARQCVDIDAACAAINRHHLQARKDTGARFKLGGKP